MKLSIITINYNNLKGLQKTMQSVFEQTWKDFEYIIIDGGSNDGSKEWIEQNSDKITYWKSEPDNGIYNALNKGILASKGEYLLMLNSGDYLVNNPSLSNVFDGNNFSEDIVYGNVLMERNGVIFTESIHPKKLNFSYLRLTMVNHQSIFIKRTLHDKVGFYDENFKTISDWKFLILAICKYNVSYLHLNFSFSVYDVDGLSSQDMFAKVNEEMKLFFINEFTAFNDDYIYLDEFINNKLSIRFKRILYQLFLNFKKVAKMIIPVNWYKKMV